MSQFCLTSEDRDALKKYNGLRCEGLHEARTVLAELMDKSSSSVNYFKTVFCHLMIERNDLSLNKAEDVLAKAKKTVLLVMAELVATGWNAFDDKDLNDDYCYIATKAFGHHPSAFSFDYWAFWMSAIKSGSEGAIEGAISSLSANGGYFSRACLDFIANNDRMDGLLKKEAQEALQEITSE